LRYGQPEIIFLTVYGTCASNIGSSGRQMPGFLDEVLDLVRIETGALELTKSEFELALLDFKASDTVADLVQARKVELSQDLPGNGLRVRADRGRVRQAIIALLSNCIALIGGNGIDNC
jgi:signal transduction histidine kinase